MKFIGYESYTSCIITIGCLIINCTSLTPLRIAGLLYVEIVDYYETDRESASIPILTFVIVRCLGGPFCGILGEKLGAENVTLYGSILAAVGFGGCMFAKNIVGIIIFLGLIYGIGMAGSNTFLPSIIKKYFNINFNTAYGISQAGSCVGAILIPPLVVYLLDKYSLPGVFLITSALMLHAVPICLIIKRAGLIQDDIIATIKRNNEYVLQKDLSVNKQKSLPVREAEDILEHKNENNYKSRSDSPKKTCISEQSVKRDNNDQKSLPDSTFHFSEEFINNEKPPDSLNITNISEQISNNYQTSFPISSTEMLKLTKEKNYHLTSSETSCAVYNNVNDSNCHKIDQMNSRLKDTNTSDLKNEIVLKPQNFKGVSNFTNINKISLLLEGKSMANIELVLENDTKDQTFTTSDIPFENSSVNTSITHEIELTKSALPKKSKFHSFKVFLNPPFLIIMLCTGLHNYVSILVWTTMIDYSRDKGIPRENEVYFLMIHPLSEMIGRVCFGWVTYMGYLSMFKYSVLSFSLMGLTSGCVLASTDFWMMILGALTFAASSGCTAAIFPGMVFSYVPEHLQTMAIASRYTLSGPLIFTSAPLIGYFREKHESYDGLYIMFITICGLCAAVMILMSKFSSHGRKATV